MNRDPDYSAAYVILHTSDTGLAGTRPDLHHRAGERRSSSAPRAAGRAARRPAGRRARRRDAARAAPARGRQPHPLARAREGRHAPRDRGGAQRAVGPVGQARSDAALGAAARARPPSELVGVPGLPARPGRHHAGRTPRHCSATRAPAAEERQARARGATAIRPTSRPRGGSAIDDADVRERVQRARAEGWRHFKLKVGGELNDDRPPRRMLRELIGPDARLMLDANQVWEVDQAIEVMARSGRAATRTGSRSPRAPTTSWATRRSPARRADPRRDR